MKILVGIKRVIDYNVRVQVSRDGTGVVKDGVKMSINPFDEIAIEEGLRIRERGDATEVVVVSIGPESAQQQLRTALAMGADRAILYQSEEEIQPLAAARGLFAVIRAEEPGLVLLGKQAIDDDANQVGQMLAALWNRPQATFVSRLEISAGVAKAKREVDLGLEQIEFDLPAVVTVDLRLNEPRFVKMPDIMKAKRKPLDIRPFAELDIEMPSRLEVGRHEPPPRRQGGIRVESTSALVKALKDKGVLT